MSIPYPFNPLGTAGPLLPPGYTRVPWLTLDGTQTEGVDTGVFADEADSWEGQAQAFNTEFAGYNGCLTTQQGPTMRYSVDARLGSALRIQRGASAAASEPGTFIVSAMYSGAVFRWVFDNTAGVAVLSGNAFNVAAFPVPHVTIGLFGRHCHYARGLAWDSLFAGRIYYSRIRRNGRTVQFLLPCRRSRDGGLTLLDVVTGREFAAPAGTNYTQD